MFIKNAWAAFDFLQNVLAVANQSNNRISGREN